MDQNRSHRDRLEEELVDRYRIQRAGRHRDVLLGMPLRTLRRVAIGLVLVIGAVACSTPTSTDVEMGKYLVFTVPAGSDEAAVSALMGGVDAVIAEVSERAGADEVAVNLHVLGNGTHEVRLTLWGENVDARALSLDLASRFTALRGATLAVERLHTKVQEPLFAKLSREVLEIEIYGASDEERRDAILRQLHASGYGEGSSVRVETTEGRQIYEIDLEGDGFREETVVEIVGDGEVRTIDVKKKDPE